MQYWVGLIVFAAIGSFVVADAISLWKSWRKGTPLNRLYGDILRLIPIAGLATVGYLVASETFTRPYDGIVFLLIGTCTAFILRFLSVFKPS